MKIKITILCTTLCLAARAQTLVSLDPAAQPPTPPGAPTTVIAAQANAPKLPPGVEAVDFSKISVDRIAYEVTCQNPRCRATSVLKPVWENASGSRTVDGGNIVSRTAIFKCPKCKQAIYESLPEEFVPRKKARMVILPEHKKSLLLRVFSKQLTAPAPMPQLKPQRGGTLAFTTTKLESPKASDPALRPMFPLLGFR
jgi:hypothetical protein